jgi:hypothetical protein
MNVRRQQLAEQFDRWATRPMFFAAFLFLVVLAGASHRIKGDLELVSDFEVYLILGSFGVLWPIFCLEAVTRFWLGGPGNPWWRASYCFLLIILPPLHLGSTGYARSNEIWLPHFGWQKVDKKLRQRLERWFSVPMIIMALLTLPLLAIEYFWKEQLGTNPNLVFALDVSTSVIWLAFAVEFILMVSVAEHKRAYIARHWLDLAIVLLPIIEALPAVRSVRAFRVLRLEQLTRFGRAYRLRALVMKLWRAMLLLEVIQRLTGQSHAKRLSRLRALLAAKEEEVSELKAEIEQLEREAEAQKPKPAPARVDEAA